MAPTTPRISVDSFSTTLPLSPNANRSDYGFPRPGSSGRPTSSSGRFRPRRSSTASSIHSVGGSLDTSHSGQPVYESGHNAISTLLQPPIVRTDFLPHTSAPASSAHKPPTARDIPPVTLSTIPHVDNSEFAPYLTQVGALYNALQRAKDNEEDGGTQLLRKGRKDNEIADLFEPERRPSSRHGASRQGSIASLASTIEIPQPRRRTSRSKQSAQAPAPLSTIPNVYFEEDFHLENPRTFDVVSERSEVVKPTPGTPDERGVGNGSATGPRKALATNAILQEKLSWYMDTVEIHLISSISSASSSFFAALGSLRDLHSEAADSVNRIKALRKELDTLDKDMALAGLEVVKKRRRRENLKQLSNAVQQLKRIVGDLRHCEGLVDAGEVEKALNAINDLERLISGNEAEKSSRGMKTSVLRDLRSATALQGVTADLDTLRYRIGKIYESRLLDLLLEDLKGHVEDVAAAEVLKRWSSSSQRSRGAHNREPSVLPAYMSMRPEFRSQLFSILSGLDRAKHVIPATAAYRDGVLREVRSIMKRYMPSSNDDDADSMMSTSTIGAGKPKAQRSSTLARNLRALDPEDAEDMLKRTYISVGETMRRLGTQVKVLLDVTSMLGEPAAAAGIRSPPRSPNIGAMGARAKPSISSGQAVQEEIHQILDMSNLLGQAVDIAQDKIVRVLKVRSEQSIHLPMEIFLRYFTLNLLFANECEAVSGRSGTALKSVVNGHIKDFVRELGERDRQTLANGMEADVWNARDFTEEDKEHLDRILASSTSDVEAWSTGSKIWLPPPNPDAPTPFLPPNGTTNGTTPPTRPTIRPATINTQTFLLPTSAILCLHGLSHLLHLLTSIPSLTLEISSTTISYLTLFNSRCTQLILGAGATRSAGLKNITTKHLALAAQALTFIGQLVPNVRECVRRCAPTNTSISQTMGEFDRVRRMIGEHESSIFEKFGEIMRGRGMAHVKTMRALDWSDDGDGGQGQGQGQGDAVDDETPNKYMETMVKETLTLHKVLSKHLPREAVEEVMRPVFGGYRELWGGAFGDVALGGRGAWERLLHDAQYFSTRLSPLDGAGDTGEYIINVVRAREPPRPVPAPIPIPVPVPISTPTPISDSPPNSTPSTTSPTLAAEANGAIAQEGIPDGEGEGSGEGEDGR